MANLLTNLLEKIKLIKYCKISIPYIIFICACFFGCLYHVSQVIQVYFTFQTKVDVSFDSESQIAVPTIGFCKPINYLLKSNSSLKEFSPSSIYNATYDVEDIFVSCAVRYNGSLRYTSKCQLGEYGVQIEKTVNFFAGVCYNFKHPQFNPHESRVRGEIYNFLLFHHKPSEFNLATINYTKNDGIVLIGGRTYILQYSRTITKLLGSPYKTNCLNYSKIGCNSRNDCVDKCVIEHSLKQCNSLPIWITFGRYNDRDQFKPLNCDWKLYNSFCHEKYKSPDCINQYYSFKSMMDCKMNESLHGKLIIPSLLDKKTYQLPKYDIDSITQIKIFYNDEPDTIYTHSPQQYTVEFICFIGGVISLWTGISVISLYAYGKRFFMGQKKIKQKAKSLFKKNAKVIPIFKRIYINHKRTYDRNFFVKKMQNKDFVIPIDIK